MLRTLAHTLATNATVQATLQAAVNRGLHSGAPDGLPAVLAAVGTGLGLDVLAALQRDGCPTASPSSRHAEVRFALLVSCAVV
jgi:hypothetical protein